MLAAVRLIGSVVEAIEQHKAGTITEDEFKAQIAANHAALQAIQAGDAAAIAARFLVKP